MNFLTFVLMVICAYYGVGAIKRRMRRKRLLEKYGDSEVVSRILAKTIWQGETEEMLKDSLGVPVAVDNKVLKNKVRETWKYGQTGKNRYTVRVILENGAVTGWNVRE
ncbi:MAG: DUF2845 domain-containing protein [Planctomycetota bacterium]